MALGTAVLCLGLYRPPGWNLVATTDAAMQERSGRHRDVVQATIPPADALQRLADAERARSSGLQDVEPQVLSVRALERFPSLLAIGVVDREYGLRWAQSRSPAAPSPADIQALEQACELALRKSIGSSLTLVDRRDLPGGGSGFLIVVPVVNGGRLSSFIVGLGTDAVIAPVYR
jgi:hypothetical protein